MKKILFILIFGISFGSAFGQSNKEIARVYIKKAEANYSNLEIDQAAKNFTKAIKLLDTIVRSDIARLGTLIQFELSEFEKAKSYAKQYFALVKSKKSEEYSQLLDLYVTIDEELEKIELENAKKRKSKIS
jgi:ribosomal protein S20